MMAAIAAGFALLLAPAIWNGFPLLQYDTGGYLARWYEGYLVPSRSTVYGLVLFWLQKPDFWPVAVLQTGMTLWTLALVLRVYGFGRRPLVLFVTAIMLALGTSLPFLTGILLTDIFAGLSVLALYLIVVRPKALTRWERAALMALIGFSVATHSATFAVILVLLGAALAVAWRRRDLVTLTGIARGVLSLALGGVMLLSANFALSGKLAWTPGGYGILFARMMQDGIVKRYLDQHCAEHAYKLCPYRNNFPETADAFLWGDSVFNTLGRFAGLDPEMREIVLGSLRAYPLWQIQAAAKAVAIQLVRVESGEGVVKEIWHTEGMVERYVPAALPGLRAARQHRTELSFDAINAIHVPVAIGSLLALLALIAIGARRRRFAQLGGLAATAAVAILANAAICSIISNPHARYGARLAWVATFVVIIAAWEMLSDACPASAEGSDS